MLIVELDGPLAEVEESLLDVNRHCLEQGAFEMRLAVDDADRARIWRGRKSAFAAMGHLSSSYIVQDGVVPRTALPQVLKDIAKLSEETGIRVANVFHAGDGNLHPLVLFDERVEGEADVYKRQALCSTYGCRSPRLMATTSCPAATRLGTK